MAFDVVNNELVFGRFTIGVATDTASHSTERTIYINGDLRFNLGPAAPVNTVAPVIGGTPTVGQIVTLTSTGTWTGSPTGYHESWRSNGVAFDSPDVLFVTLTNANYNQIITCVVEADNAVGPGYATSNSLGPVAGVGPSAFSFTDVTNVPVSTLETSNTITLSGMSGTYTASVSGGEMQKNGGTWGTSSQSVVNGDTLAVRHTSSAVNSTQTDTTLTVSGTGTSVSDTFSSTTAAASGAAVSAPTLGFFSPVASNPSTLVYNVGWDWNEGDVAKLQYSSSVGFGTYTTLTHTLTATDITNGTFSFPLPTFSGITYVRGFNSRAGADSTNISYIVAWGETTAPVITNTEVTGSPYHLTETLKLWKPITITETGSGVPATISVDKVMPGYYIAGGNDQLQYELAVVAGVLGYRWVNDGAQTYNSFVDQGGNNIFDLTVGCIDYCGNRATEVGLQTQIDQADLSPSAFTFTDVTNATRSQSYTSNTITIAGLSTGVNAAVSVTGGTYSKNGGGFTSSAGTVQNGDTLAVQLTSSSLYETPVNCTLTVGSGPAVSDTYTVQTLADPANIPWTAGTVVTGTSAGANVNFGNINFTQTGTFICLAKCTNGVRFTGMTVGGSAATVVSQSNASDASGAITLIRFDITSTGNKAVVGTTGSFPSGGTLLYGMLVPTSSTPTTSGLGKAAGFGLDPKALGTTVTDPTSGIIIVGILTPTTPAWVSPVVASLYDATSGIAIGIARQTCNPSFNSDGLNSFHAFAVGAWG